MLSSIAIAAMLTPIRSEADKIAPPLDLKQMTVSALIEHYAVQYQIDPRLADMTMKCESGGNTHAHNKTAREDSWGLSQINLLAHTDITKEQATDKVFAIEFLVKGIAEGNGDMWYICYRKAKNALY